jgi:hypothetical protein
MSPIRHSNHGEHGFSAGAGLVASALGLALMAVLLVVGMNEFGSGGSTGKPGANPSILSQSNAQTQIKLCAEGRDSSYGDPPTPAQQATCVRDLIGEVGDTGSSGPGNP